MREYKGLSAQPTGAEGETTVRRRDPLTLDHGTGGGFPEIRHHAQDMPPEHPSVLNGFFGCEFPMAVSGSLQAVDFMLPWKGRFGWDQ